MTPELQVIKFSEDAQLPFRKYETDAGYDLHANEDAFLTPGTPLLISTGIGVRVPRGYVGLIMDRSSMSSKGIIVSGGVIDSLFSGLVKVILTNTEFNNIKKINKGDRIAQLVVLQLPGLDTKEVTQVWASERGIQGFGSSGK